MRRLAAAAAAVALATSVAGGCASERDRLGKGDDVGFCVAWEEFEALEAPSITDQDEVLDWTTASRNIIERVDLREEINERKPQPTVKRLLENVDRTLEDFDDAVKSADDAESLRVASARLGPAFDRQLDELTLIKDRSCTAEERAGS